MVKASTHRSTIALAALLVAALFITACGSSGSAATTSNRSSQSGGTSQSGRKSLSVAYMVAGTLGDLSVHDSAERGIRMAAATLGAKVKTIEGGTDATTTWQTDLQDLTASHSWDLIVTDTSYVLDQLKAVAQQNPHQEYILLDQQLNLPNVVSVTYLQNDGAFLAGVLAAIVARDKKDFPLSSGAGNVGIVGGQNIPVINDFVVGFKKGVAVIDPAMKVQVSYVGNFVDAQTGYSQAAAMYSSGADVVFAAAGGAGLGVLKASKAMNKYSIGVDSNQNNIEPKNVLASDLKNVAASLYSMLEKYKAGTLQLGHTYVYGIPNGGVGLLLNTALVPPSVAARIEGYTRQVAAGKIQVPCVAGFCSPATP